MVDGNTSTSSGIIGWRPLSQDLFLTAFVSEVFDVLELKHNHQCLCIKVLGIGIDCGTRGIAY